MTSSDAHDRPAPQVNCATPVDSSLAGSDRGGAARAFVVRPACRFHGQPSSLPAHREPGSPAPPSNCDRPHARHLVGHAAGQTGVLAKDQGCPAGAVSSDHSATCRTQSQRLTRAAARSWRDRSIAHFSDWRAAWSMARGLPSTVTPQTAVACPLRSSVLESHHEPPRRRGPGLEPLPAPRSRRCTAIPSSRRPRPPESMARQRLAVGLAVRRHWLHKQQTPRAGETRMLTVETA